jgi:membrane-bound lytic murein transglycosylase MltF
MKSRTLFIQLGLIFVLVGSARSQQHLESLLGRSRPYETLIASAAARYDVEPELLWTIAYLESRFRPEAVSYKDGKPCAFGMMQFIAPTARRYGLSNPHNVYDAVDAAARYVRDLTKRFGGNRALILAAYNAGEGTVEAFREGKKLVLSNGKIINPLALRTGGVPPYKETRNYVAQGDRVYQRIVEWSLFQHPMNRTNEDSASQKLRRNSRSGATSNTIYVLTLQDAAETDRVLPTSKARQKSAQSIYVN